MMTESVPLGQLVSISVRKWNVFRPYHYDTSDLASWFFCRCECGYEQAVINNGKGRLIDHLEECLSDCPHDASERKEL
jgi:hypothetical protein